MFGSWRSTINHDVRKANTIPGTAQRDAISKNAVLLLGLNTGTGAAGNRAGHAEVQHSGGRAKALELLFFPTAKESVNVFTS